MLFPRPSKTGMFLESVHGCIQSVSREEHLPPSDSKMNPISSVLSDTPRNVYVQLETRHKYVPIGSLKTSLGNCPTSCIHAVVFLKVSSWTYTYHGLRLWILVEGKGDTYSAASTVKTTPSTPVTLTCVPAGISAPLTFQVESSTVTLPTPLEIGAVRENTRPIY